MPPLRSAAAVLAVLGAAASLSLAAAGCNDDDPSESAATSTSGGARRVQPEKGSKGKKKVTAEAPKAVTTPGRSPGIKASDPRYAGQYAARVSKAQGKRFNAPPGTSAKWTLQLLRGTYNLATGSTLVVGTLRVSGDRMVFRQRGGCNIPKPQKVAKPPGRLGPPGKYRWHLSGRRLTFDPISEPCRSRRRQLSTLRWTLLLKAASPTGRGESKGSN